MLARAVDADRRHRRDRGERAVPVNKMRFARGHLGGAHAARVREDVRGLFDGDAATGSNHLFVALTVEQRAQIVAGVRGFDLGDFLRRADGHEQLPPSDPASGPRSTR